MRRLLLTLGILMLLAGVGASKAQASLIYYSSQASFNAAGPVVSTQTFASANVAPNSGLYMNNSLSNSTNNGIFSTGNILPGLAISATGTNPGTDLFIGGQGVFGITNKSVFATYFVETLNISFAGGVTAVSLGLLSEYNSSNFTLSIFNTSNVLIGTTSVLNVANSGTGTFFGVTANGGDVIGRINLSSDTGEAEGIDRIQFGSANPVPVPSSLALTGIGIISIAAFRGLRRGRPALKI